jgi:hypothetical protein
MICICKYIYVYVYVYVNRYIHIFISLNCYYIIGIHIISLMYSYLYIYICICICIIYTYQYDMLDMYIHVHSCTLTTSAWPLIDPQESLVLIIHTWASHNPHHSEDQSNTLQLNVCPGNSTWCVHKHKTTCPSTDEALSNYVCIPPSHVSFLSIWHH